MPGSWATCGPVGLQSVSCCKQSWHELTKFAKFTKFIISVYKVRRFLAVFVATFCLVSSWMTYLCSWDLMIHTIGLAGCQNYVKQAWNSLNQTFQAKSSKLAIRNEGDAMLTLSMFACLRYSLGVVLLGVQSISGFKIVKRNIQKAHSSTPSSSSQFFPVFILLNQLGQQLNQLLFLDGSRGSRCVWATLPERRGTRRWNHSLQHLELQQGKSRCSVKLCQAMSSYVNLSWQAAICAATTSKPQFMKV